MTNRMKSVLALVMLMTLTATPALSSEKRDGMAPTSVKGAVTVDVAEAKALYDRGVPFIDVRPGQMFKDGHIAGGISLPLTGQFTKKTIGAVVGKEDEVVIHCRGINCMMGSQAAKRAVKWGYKRIYYFREGYNGWKERYAVVEPDEAVAVAK